MEKKQQKYHRLYRIWIGAKKIYGTKLLSVGVGDHGQGSLLKVKLQSKTCWLGLTSSSFLYKPTPSTAMVCWCLGSLLSSLTSHVQGISAKK